MLKLAPQHYAFYNGGNMHFRGKSSVIGVNLTVGSFRCKTSAVVCTMKLKKKQQVSAVSLHGTLHMN